MKRFTISRPAFVNRQICVNSDLAAGSIVGDTGPAGYHVCHSTRKPELSMRLITLAAALSLSAAPAFAEDLVFSLVNASSVNLQEL